MARQPSIKQIQRIHKAAESLVAKGIESPTNDQVLEEMEGGSIADVSPAMREWRKKKKQAEQVMFSMPDAVKNSGLNLLAQMWAVIDNEAQKKIELAHTEAMSKTSELEEELQTCLNSLAKLEESLAIKAKETTLLTTKLKASTNEIKKLENLSHQIELEKEKASTRLETAKENETHLRKQVDDLQKELIAVAKQRGSNK